MEVIFEALMKQMSIKSLVSGDKEARLLLEFNASDDKLLSNLNKLHKADEMVKVKISR
uniref:ACT domain-containing protein n=1 Tax=viral metagenome TaxID=1070528 RepID=A0A6M3MAU4_9ZZZZ